MRGRIMYGSPPRPPDAATRRANIERALVAVDERRSRASGYLEGAAEAYNNAATLLRERAGREFAACHDELAKALREASEEFLQLAQANQHQLDSLADSPSEGSTGSP